MRTTKFPFRNNQWLEVFVESRGKPKDGFEVWIAGEAKGERMVLDHLITHDDLETHLCYAQPDDLQWRAARKSEIPDKKTECAIEYETECLDRGMFRDDPNGDIAMHLVVGIMLPRDRKMMNVARKAMVGTWTDGVATLVFQTESKIQISCTDHSHPLYRWAPQPEDETRIRGTHIAEWWNFSVWYLLIFNQQAQAGEKLAVWRCDDDELHMTSGWGNKAFAHIYRRVLPD